MKESSDHDVQNIVSLDKFRRKKEGEKRFSPNRKPLTSSHLGQRKSDSGDSALSDRLGRIRASLERINHLMFELKRMNPENRRADKIQNTKQIDRRDPSK